MRAQGLVYVKGMKLEWRNGVDAYAKEGASGLARFSAGVARHGDFENI